jgi:hypothetical protein
MKNVGSTTVTYEWKKIVRGDYIPSKHSDGIQRFYCHYPRSTLKPGEAKTFIFSFRSEKPGMFNEEWELLTEPQLITPAPILNLSGMATRVDEFIDSRHELEDTFQRELQRTKEIEVVEALASRPMSPPVFDETFEQQFNSANQHLGLQFNSSLYEDLHSLYTLVVKRLGIQGSDEAIEEFSTDVEYIEELITRIANPYTKQSLQDKYIDLYYRAKKTPIESSISYDIFKAMVQNFTEDIVEIDERIRKETGMIENLGFEPVPEE